MIDLPWHDTRRMLRKYAVTPKKKMGQTFLTDAVVARKIVEAAEVSESDHVLEIGGGLGILTVWLAQRARKVTVIEIDSKLARALRERFTDSNNLEIIQGDALVVPLPEVDKVVANLPYSISSEITFRLIDECEFDVAVLMYQKEFAERLLAKPGSREYSRLSIDIQYKMVIEPVILVPANKFYPEPAVDSIVVKMHKRTEGPFARDERIFYWIVHGLFAYPNKHLRKALRIWFKNIGVEKEQADRLITATNGIVDGTERLRSLSLGKLVRLADETLCLVEDGTLPDPRSES